MAPNWLFYTGPFYPLPIPVYTGPPMPLPIPVFALGFYTELGYELANPPYIWFELAFFIIIFL